MSNNRHSQNTTLREEKTIPCKCGQRNSLIWLPDGWHYHKKYGNDSLSNGKCLNCHAPLDMSLAVDIFIVPNHPYWTEQERIFQEDKVWYDATPDEITAIRKKVPGWTPDNPQWSEVKAKLLKISNSSIRFADCKDMKFGDIAAIFRNESDAEKPAETEQENKVVQERQEGVLEPKPPEFLQKLLWIMKYGRSHWKLVLLALLLLLVLSYFRFA